MEDDVNLDEILAERIRAFENAEEITRPAREVAERCRDYYDNKQWTEDEEKKIKSRGQPVVTFNEIKPKINTMRGLEKQTRKDPKAYPRNPQDDQAAHAATDVIRYVCDNDNWSDKRSQAAMELAIEGTCAVLVGAKETRNGIDPDIRRIAWDRFYYDPASSEFDFEDAKFLGIVIWMDLSDAVRKYPWAKDILETTWRRAQDSETYDDKPKHGLWADYKRQRVRLCEEYYNDGGWKFCIFTQAGFIVEPMDSPYLDDEGKPECPIHAVSLYVDRDNNRYGEVQAMLSPQDEVNKRRSKALYLTSQRQVRVSPNVADKPDKVRKELSRPDGVFIGEPGDVEVLPTNDMASGNLRLMQDARDHIHRLGANNALAGKDTAAQSGRAILAQQQGGMVESSTYLDCIRVLSLKVYRSIWARVRQFWNEERWVRVTDNENNLKFVGINRPVTALKMAAQRLGVDPDNLEQADPQAVAMLEAFAQDPRSQTVVAIENNLGELDVDIIVDEGMDAPTIAAEQWQELVQLAQAGVPIPPPLLIEASSLRNKDRLLEMLNQPPSEEQQMAAQMQMAAGQAEIENTQADTAKKTAEAQATQVKLVTEAYKAAAA